MIMTTTISYSKNTFGYIYKKALKIQLKQIGENLSSIRKSRNESVEKVADMLCMSPKELNKIEKGYSDFRLQELLDLCKYYKIDVLTAVKESGLMQFRFV